MRVRTRNPCRELFYTGILYLFLFITVINADGCKREGCHRSDSGKLKYLPNIGYQYSFDSVVSIGVQNAQSEETDMSLKGHAILYYEGDCLYTLKLENVQVKTTLEKLHKEMKNDFDKPIQFTMINGELDSQICSDKNDNKFSLNIKRGIISMFQNSNSKYETDVFGLCPSEITTQTESNGMEIITKLRNLNLCSYRENIIAFFATGIVNEKAGVKSRPFLNGEYHKEQKVLNGIYQNIELIEKYNSPQQNKGKSVVWTNVKTNLKLDLQQPQSIPKLTNTKSTSIIFHPPTTNGVQNLSALRKVFDETVNLLNDYTKADSAQHFSELIRLMRNSDVNTLIELSAQNNNLAKKVYFDALIRTGTPESVQAIVKQIGTWNDNEKKIALTFLALVPTIDLNTLNVVASLLTPNADREAYLSIGTLISTYCKENSCDNNEMSFITDKFINALNNNCNANTKKDEEHILSVLKGIRNCQHIANTITQKLIECTNHNNSPRIRVAALQSYSASSCNQHLQANSLNILRDRNEDSEIRIEAYLSLINCPNAQIANDIADIINTETVYQVGGFITSHLKAIRDSTDFTKETLKHYLGNIRITKKFPIDPRRYSFNSEFSYAIDSLGIGASADYNIIYSQKGFLPRSIRVNLTSELFGTSINTFDLNVRQDNMENILEHFFGPKGFLSKEPQEILNQINNYIVTPNQNDNDHHRRLKRNYKDDTNNMAIKYKTYGSDNNKFLNDINFDLSLKIFGSEFAFLSMGNNIPSNAEELSYILRNTFTNFKNGIKKYEKICETHALLHDIELVYPTGLGLPLEIAVKSATTGKLDFAIEIDVDQIIDNYKNTKYRLKFIPNNDINFETFLRIDSGLLSTGLRTSSNVHSADGGDIYIDFINDNEKGFNIDLKLPRQNVELIEFKHNVDFFITEQDKEINIIPFKQNKKRKTYQPVCFDQLQIFGLTVCYTANLPSETDLSTLNNDNNINNNKLPYLLNGPMQMSLILHTEKHIQLQGRHKNNIEYQTWQLIYDTPGSSDSHKTELLFKLGVQPKLFMRLDFINPQTHLAGEWGLINNNNEFAIYGKFETNNGKGIQKIGFTKNGNEYRPLIQLQLDDSKTDGIAGYKADGRIIVDNNNNGVQKYNFDNFRIINPNNENVIINGWLEYNQYKGFNSELNIKKSEDKTYQIDSYFKRDTKTSLAIGGFVTENQNPDTTVGGSLMLDMNLDNLKHEFKIQTGQHYLKLNNEYENTDSSDIENRILKFINYIEVKNIKESTPLVSAKLNGELSKKNVSFDFEITRLDKVILMNLKLLRNQRTNGDFDLNFKTKINRHFVDLKTKIDVKQGKYFIDNVFVTSWGTQANINGEINQQITIQNALIDLNGSFKLNNNDKDNTFILKITDIQDKFNGEFKLKRDNIELLTCIAEIQQLTDKQNGNFKFTIKDNLNLNGKYNLNKNGRGDFNGVIHLKKAGKPIKINSKFLYALPKFNLDTTIVFDEKKIIYKTENEFSKTKFNTKNILEVGTEKLQFSVSLKTNDGETNSEFLFVLPNERKFNGNINCIKNIKNKNKELKIELNDILPNEQKRSLKLNGAITDLNNVKNYYNINYKLQLNNFDERNLIITLNSKNLPKDNTDYHQASINIVLSGTLLENIKFDLNIDEYSKQHAVYKLDCNYGKKILTKINGNYNINKLQNQLIYNYDTNININAPETEFKLLNLITNGKYINNINDNSYDIDSKLYYQITNINHNFNMKLNGNHENGEYNLNIECPKLGKNIINGQYNRQLNLNNDIKSGKMEYKTNFKFEKYGNADINLLIDFIENKNINIYYTIKSTFEKLKNFNFILNGLNNDNNDIQTNIELNHNNDKYILNSITYTSITKTGIDINIKTPTKLNSKILCIFNKYADHHIKGELIINDIIELDLNNKIELKFSSPDDFYIITELNSNKLKINNINADIRAENKGLHININSNNGKLLNGFIQFNIKNEKNKIIIEGRGDIIYKNEKKPASFKLVKQLFDLNNSNNEIGFEYTFNSELGPKNFVSTLKLTNKNFIMKLTGCEESKQCTNIEVQSVITLKENDLKNIIHELMILIDLRELGYPHEFELQSKSSKLGLNIKHDIEITMTSNNNNKYKFLVKIKPDNNLIELILPKRHIVLETLNKLPDNNALFGIYQNSIEFYFDKLNKPNDKTTLLFVANLSGLREEILNGNIELKFINPYLKRPLLITGNAKSDIKNKFAQANIIFDIFELDEQKIIGECEIKNQYEDKKLNYLAETKFYSKGLNFQYKTNAIANFNYLEPEIHLESSAEGGSNDLKFLIKFIGNKDRFDMQLIALNQQLFNMRGILDTTKKLLKTESTYQVIGSKPIKLITEFMPSKYKIILKRDGLLQAIGELNVGKEIRLQLNKGNDNKQIYNAKLSLEPTTFLVSQYDVNKDELNDFMKMAEKELSSDITTAQTKLHDKYTKGIEIINQRIKKNIENLPDFRQTIDAYNNNIKSILNELEEDPSLKNLFVEFRNLYKKCLTFVQDFITKTTDLYTKIKLSFIEFYEKQQQLFNETILPALTDLNKKIHEILIEFYSELMKICRQIFDRANKAFKNFENDFKELSKPLLEILKPFNDMLNDLWKIFIKEWNDFWIEFKEYINKLPTIFKNSFNLNEQLNKLRKINILAILRDIFQQLETYATSNELKEFLNILLKFIENKLSSLNNDNNNINDNINDIEELEKIYYSLIKAINSIIIQLTGDNNNSNIININNDLTQQYYYSIIKPIQLTIDIIKKLPIWLSFEFSSLNYIKNEHFNTVYDLLLYNLPKTIDLLPPYQLNGHIANGKNIFTFDGRYITLSDTTCKYILAQDSINNNFTIIGNYNMDKLQSIILIDKNNQVEIDNNSILKLNDKKMEYPIHNNGINVWRRYYTITILSDFGVMLKCTIDLSVCHISINGFYTSKTRGLFGNGNSEPYDDFTVQNGNILDNSIDFINSYNLNNDINCKKTMKNQIDLENMIKTNSICNELFDYDSSLLFGYIFMNKKPYVDACNIAIQLNNNNNNDYINEDIACNIALTYASAIQLNHHIPISIPKRCVKCKQNNNKILNVDDDFTIKIPNNKADVIIIIDTNMSDDIKNDLIQPILNGIRQQLKNRNLNDINIVVIGYNKNQKYPNLLTTNGKLNFNGKFIDMTLTGPKYDEFPYNIGINKLNELIEKIRQIYTPKASDFKAITLASDYPFRADAAKTILLIKDDSSQFPLLNMFSTPVLSLLFKNKGISFNYIGNIKDLTVDGKSSDKLVGFSKRAIAFLNGLGKRQKLEYANNQIIDTLSDDDSWIFALNNFKQLKTPDTKKLFATQVSSMLADQLYKTEITSNCLCSLKYGLHGETLCTKTSYEYISTKKHVAQKQG